MSFLDKLLDFVRLTHEAHRVERVARIPGEKRYANMVEHSWQLALVAWYIIDAKKLPLDKERVLRYALAHDIVETYAGDTFLYDEEAKATQKQREREARDQIEREHPLFSDLIAAIDEYEAKEDDESKFVYALDKLIDPINIFLEDGLLWREKGISLDMHVEKKKAKVEYSPPVRELFYDLLERLEEREGELFSHRKTHV